MMYRIFLVIFLNSPGTWAADCTSTSIDVTPLNDLGEGLYLDSFEGGLYPLGSNQIPQVHKDVGAVALDRIQPRDASGGPDPEGAIVLLSIGMSNASAEFRKFEENAETDPRVNQNTLRIVNGAGSGLAAFSWVSSDLEAYDRAQQILQNEGLTEAQVQVVWLKAATGFPTVSLPDPDADAFVLLEAVGDIARAVRTRYPNVQMLFVSSRTYGGYASVDLNPEPFAYETGFGVKWAIEAQIRQEANGSPDPAAGDLEYPTAAPWMAWGPYLWADGERSRSDGLQWFCSDFQDDGTHPSPTGNEKAADLLMEFFLESSFTAPWFNAGRRITVLSSDSAFFATGSTLELAAPVGTNYQWKKNGEELSEAPPRLSGTDTSVLTLDGLRLSDSGTYTVSYDDGTKAVVESAPFELTVTPASALPLATIAGIAVLFAGLLTAFYGGLRRIGNENQQSAP